MQLEKFKFIFQADIWPKFLAGSSLKRSAVNAVVETKGGARVPTILTNNTFLVTPLCPLSFLLHLMLFSLLVVLEQLLILRIFSIAWTHLSLTTLHSIKITPITMNTITLPLNARRYEYKQKVTINNRFKTTLEAILSTDQETQTLGIESLVGYIENSITLSLYSPLHHHPIRYHFSFQIQHELKSFVIVKKYLRPYRTSFFLKMQMPNWLLWSYQLLFPLKVLPFTLFHCT